MSCESMSIGFSIALCILTYITANSVVAMTAPSCISRNECCRWKEGRRLGSTVKSKYFLHEIHEQQE